MPVGGPRWGTEEAREQGQNLVFSSAGRFQSYLLSYAFQIETILGEKCEKGSRTAVTTFSLERGLNFLNCTYKHLKTTTAVYEILYM